MRNPIKQTLSCTLSASLSLAACPWPCGAIADSRSPSETKVRVLRPVAPIARLNLDSARFPLIRTAFNTGIFAAAPVNRLSGNAASSISPPNLVAQAQALAQEAVPQAVADEPIEARDAREGADGPAARRLKALFENPSLYKVRSQGSRKAAEGLREFYDEASILRRFPFLVEDELSELGPKLLGRSLSPSEADDVLSRTSLGKVRWYHYLNPRSEPAASEGITHADKSIELRLHWDWRKVPSLENHLRAVFAHEYVHRLQLDGIWRRAYGAEAGPVAVHLLRAIELSGLGALRAGAFSSFVNGQVLDAFEAGRGWARSDRKTAEESFYLNGFLAGAAFELAQRTGRWEDSWKFLRRVFSAREAQKPQAAFASLRDAPFLRKVLDRAAVFLPPVALWAPGVALGESLKPVFRVLGGAGYYVSNATGFLYPLFQIRKTFADGNAKAVPIRETILGVLASLALAVNATALGHAFWAVQNIFGALALIAPVIIGNLLKGPAPNSWLKASLAALVLLGLSVALYAAAASFVPALLGQVLASSGAITLGIQIGAAVLFFLMFSSPIVSVLKGRVPKGFDRFFSLCFSIGGLSAAIWCVDQALVAKPSSQFLQFVVYGVSQLVLATVSFASYLLIRKDSAKRP